MNENLIRKETIFNRLLVEGPDDEHVCLHLLKHQGLHEHISIINKKGIDSLLKELPVELLASGETHLGIVVDADNDLSARWQSLREILIKSDFKTVPLRPEPGGTLIQEENRHVVGIWLMPNNQIPGILENFLSDLVPPNDLLWTIAEHTLEHVMKQDRRFPEVHKMKAHIHTWLAWQKEPGKPLGQAITKRYLDPSAPSAQNFIDWMCRVFVFE